jgi:hypothetical protein
VAKEKKDKRKVPKNVAGVKVPKALRQGLVASFLEDPRTREILADVLMAAAGAAAAALVKNRPNGQQVKEAGASAAGATRDVAQLAAEAVTDSVAEAARRILPSSLTGAGQEGAGGEDERPGEPNLGHLSDRDAKGKKDKNRSKASKP